MIVPDIPTKSKQKTGYGQRIDSNRQPILAVRCSRSVVTIATVVFKSNSHRQKMPIGALPVSLV